MWVILEGDAIDTLSTLAPCSVDAVVMDPPYCSGGVNEQTARRSKAQGKRSETVKSQRFQWFDTDNMGTSGLVFLLRSVALQLARVLKDGGSILTFADWRQIDNVGPAIDSAGLRRQNLIVWDKGSMGLGRGFRMQHELILHHTKGTAVFHDASTPNVLRHKRVTRNQQTHPTEKPVDLLRDLIRPICPTGGVVLDPFCGSASTGEAAHLQGCHFVGIEKAAQYAEIARQRMERLCPRS